MNSQTNKILYLCPNGYLGGAERFVVDAVTQHRQGGGWHSEIFFFNGTGDAVELCKNRDLPYHVLPHGFRLSRPWQLFQAVKHLRKFIASQDFDIVHGTMPYGHIVGWLATLGLPCARVWFQHGPVGGLLDKIACFLLPDALVYNSEFLKTHHLSYDLVNRHRHIHWIIPYGISQAAIDKSRVDGIKEKFAPNGEEIIMLAGRICSWKGYETFIDAFDHFRKRVPADRFNRFTCLIIGDAKMAADKDYFQNLQNQVLAKGLGSCIHFLGKKTDLENYFAASHFFIHTSRIPEPFGLVIGEAMMQNALVIGSNQGGIRDILIHEETGYSFNATAENASHELRELLFQVLEGNKEQHQKQVRIVQTARSYVEERFSLAGMQKNLENLYQKLLQKRRG